MIGEEPKEESKGVELKSIFWADGEVVTEGERLKLNKNEVLYYIGKSSVYGDMFFTKEDHSNIRFYTGNLNNGTY